MSNTSATGGYLAPLSTYGNLDDDQFSVFLQSVVVGITGLPGNMVRPRWQAESPNLPAYGTDWCAIGSVKRNSDTFPYTGHISSGDGYDIVYRNQEMDVIASFYGPDAEYYSDLLAMGLIVEQNREALFNNGYALVSCSEAVMLADLLNEKWTRRVDLPFVLRRAQVYSYPVLNVESAEVTYIPDALNSKQVAVEVIEGYGLAGYGLGPYGE